MTDEITAGVSIEEYEGEEQPFKPAQAILEFTLEKIKKDYAPPELPSMQKITPQPSKEKAVLVDVETTGAKPWDSRIISIAAKNLQEPSEQVIVFINEDEETLIKQFIEWYEDNEFEEFWAYNTTYNFRALIIACTRYRVQAEKLAKSKKKDLKTMLTQAKASGGTEEKISASLSTWAEYLLGEKPSISIFESWKAWEGKDFDKVMDYNAQKLGIEYDLWLLTQFVNGKISMLPPELEASGSESVKGETKLVQCPVCHQIQEVPKTAKTAKCKVCGEEFSTE